MTFRKRNGESKRRPNRLRITTPYIRSIRFRDFSNVRFRPFASTGRTKRVSWNNTSSLPSTENIIRRLERHTIRLFVGRRYAFYTLPELVYTAINILAAVGFPLLRTVKYVHALARRSTRFNPRGAIVDRTAQSKR